MTLLLLTRCISWAEGISFLILLGIAVPLKHLYNEPLAVRYVGMAHGVLFMAILVAVALIISRHKLPMKVWAWGFIAALVPAGPFIYDRYLMRKISEHQG